MSRPTAWYPRYPDNFISATQHLTLEEVGAYNRLLDFHFLHGSVPTDIKRMALIIGASSQKTRKLWQVLSQFFYEKDGAFYNKRMVKEISKATEISDKRAKAAQKRWDANADANGDASADTTYNLQPTVKNKTHTVRTATRFDEWWDAYANKKNRKGALAIWKRRKLDNIADELIADAKRRHAHDDAWKRGYQPHPTTYLNGERWNDELTQARQNPGKPPVRESAHERSQRIIQEQADEIARTIHR